MKKIFQMLTVILFLLSVSINTSQSQDISSEQISYLPLNFDAVVLEGNEKLLKIPSGTKISILEIKQYQGFHYRVFYRANDTTLRDLTYDNFKQLNLQSTSYDGFWKWYGLKSWYDNMLRYGYQYKLRRELENDALDYLETLSSRNLLFNDSYLEDYLYILLNKLYPKPIKDGRPGILNIKVVRNPTPNAGVFPNGTLLINTGLLTTINSEDELLAIMAHEISHFVLDHEVTNIQQEKERKQSAEFWTGFTTLVTALGETYAAVQNRNYKVGTLTSTVAAVSYSIATAINKQLGLQFSREQELIADKCAVDLLKILKLNPSALSTALSKIKKYCISAGDYLALSGEGTHPAIDERIKIIGDATEITDPSYDRKISLVISENANHEIQMKHFELCKELVERNISAGVATEDDLILRAMTNLYMSNTSESNKDALNFLARAESLNVTPTFQLLKWKGIALLRNNNKQEAKKIFESYLSKLNDHYNDLEKILNVNLWTTRKNLLDEEIVWTKKMIHKIRLL